MSGIQDLVVSKLTELGWVIDVTESLISATVPTGLEYTFKNDELGQAFVKGICCGAVGQELSWQAAFTSPDLADAKNEDARNG